jgi:hypothetical protein
MEEEEEKKNTYRCENQKERDHQVDFDIHGRIILKRFVEK